MSVHLYFESLHYFTLHRVKIVPRREEKSAQLFYELFGVNFASTGMW